MKVLNDIYRIQCVSVCVCVCVWVGDVLISLNILVSLCVCLFFFFFFFFFFVSYIYFSSFKDIDPSFLNLITFDELHKLLYYTIIIIHLSAVIYVGYSLFYNWTHLKFRLIIWNGSVILRPHSLSEAFCAAFLSSASFLSQRLPARWLRARSHNRSSARMNFLPLCESSHANSS